MRTLRSTLCILYVIIGAPMLVGVISQLRRTVLEPFYAPHLSFLVLTADLFLPVCGCLFLLAAVSYWRRWRSAKMWCLLIGIMNIGAAALVVCVVWRYVHGQVAELLPMVFITLGVGVVGVWAFAGWKPEEDSPAAQTELTAARKGDGTWSWLNRIHIFIQYVGIFVIWNAWWAWGNHLHLGQVGIMSSLVQITVATMVLVALHEAGHALFGMAMGGKLLFFFAGPFQWQVLEGRWRFRFCLKDLLLTGGVTGVVPQQIHEPRWSEFCMVAAGPAVNVVTGSLAVWVALRSPGSPWQPYWFLVGMFGLLSLFIAAFNLIPLRSDGVYTDGARMYQIVQGGVWYEQGEVRRAAAATVVTALRPRDYDIDAIHRVLEAGVVSGMHELLLHLFAHSYYVDRQQMTEAGRELKAAEAVFDAHEKKIPGELLNNIVMHEAMDWRDADAVRLWWERLESKKPKRLNGDYWMARSAYCWAEGNREEAQVAWERAREILNKMPNTGTYMYDREQLAKLEGLMGTFSPLAEPVV